MTKARRVQYAAPEAFIPFVGCEGLNGQSAVANAAYEHPVFRAFGPTRLLNLAYVPITTVTGAAAGAYLYFNLYRGGVQLCGDGVLGGFSFSGTGLNAVAVQGVALGASPVVPAVQGCAWTGSSAGVTANSSTSDTLVALGNSSITYIINPAFSLTYDLGLATQETLPSGQWTYNAGTGVVTIAATYNSGKFAQTHAAGALVVMQADWLYVGTVGAITGGTTTSVTLTARGSAANTAIGATSAAVLNSTVLDLTLDPGLTTQEILPAGQWSISTNTVSPASTYNGGKFAVTHSANATAVLASKQGSGQPLHAYLLAGDVITAKWKQLGTGLALPESTIFTDYGPY